MSGIPKRIRMTRIQSNRNQRGLKMQGSANGIGQRSRFVTRQVNRQINTNSKIGCVDNGKLTGKLLVFSNGQQTCTDNEGYRLIPKAPRSRACAGSVGQIMHTRCNYIGNNTSSDGPGPIPPPPVLCNLFRNGI